MEIQRLQTNTYSYITNTLNNWKLAPYEYYNIILHLKKKRFKKHVLYYKETQTSTVIAKI